MPYEMTFFQLPSGARAARVRPHGLLTGEEAAAMLRECGPGGPIFGLPTLVLTQDMAQMSPEARSAFSAWKETLSTESFAIVVTNAVIRVTTNFIFRVSKNPRRRMFTDEPSAIQWLEERVRETQAAAPRERADKPGTGKP